MTGPLLDTRSAGRSPAVPVQIRTQPPGTLYRMALSTRLLASRSTSRGAPAVQAGASSEVTSVPSTAAGSRSRSTPATTGRRSSGARTSRPRWLLASVSSASIRRS